MEPRKRMKKICLELEQFEDRTVPTIFTVTTILDNGDNDNPTAGSLREAIIAANNHSNFGLLTDLIQFNIPGAGVHTISPIQELPVILDPVIIDGYSQPGASPNTLATGDNAVLTIELSGSAAPAGASGLLIKGGSTTVRGLVINGFPGDRNFDGGNGIFLLNVAGNSDNVITGNFIGTNAAGNTAVPNGTGIIAFEKATRTLVGGAAPAARNLVSGNARIGIVFGSDGNVAQGNFIGTDATGAAALGNHFSGIVVSGSNNIIGGTSLAAGNVIAFNGDNGVAVGAVGDPPLGNSILGNSLFSNHGLGIDLNFNAVTVNDAGDADGGPNHLQNFPVLTSAVTIGQASLITGTLNSTPGVEFRIELFSQPDSDPSGFGEGRTFVVRFPVFTNGDGTINWRISGFVIPVGQFVTATATNLTTGDTSEFSQALRVDQPGQLQFSAPTFSAGENGGNAVVTVTRTGGSGGIVTVKMVTTGGTATAGTDFTDASQTLTFAHGETSKTIIIPIRQDTLLEGNETVNLTLSKPTGGATLGTPVSAVLAIIDAPGAQVANGVLTVSGTLADDVIFLLPAGPKKNLVQVLGDGQALGVFAARRLLVLGRPGNDRIRVGRGVKLPAVLAGGPDNDVLTGGGGRNTLLGGPGKDTLIAGTPNDILNGGPGQDGAVFFGTPGDDVIRIGWLPGPRIEVDINGQVIREAYLNCETVTVEARAGDDVVILEPSAARHWRARFLGGEGEDLLIGGLRSDLLDGGAGINLLDGRGGHDRLRHGLNLARLRENGGAVAALDYFFARHGHLLEMLSDIST